MEYYPYNKKYGDFNAPDGRQIIEITWTNPYTEKEEWDAVWVPNSFILQIFREYAKDKFNMNLFDTTDEQLIMFLNQLSLDVRNLMNVEEFEDLCVQKFKESGDYEKAQAEFLDDYEAENNLGSYSDDNYDY